MTRGRDDRRPIDDRPGRRLFVAVPLPAATTEAVAALVDRVRSAGVPGGGRDVRWVRLDGLHITLRFLGPTLEPAIPPIQDAVRAVAAAASPFELVVDGAGAFPSPGRPRAIFLDISDGAVELGGLAGAVDRALEPLGWPASDRPFRAHLTLARSDGVAAGSAIATRLADAARGLQLRAKVDRLGLYESLTGGGPARYEPLELADLG
jgi:RNA 2',3'-cyclic 3'-phosphodiesterase